MYKICYITTISLSIKAFFIPQLQYLAQKGFEVCVICSSDDKLQSALGHNIKYIPVDIPRGLSIYKTIKGIKELKRIFKKEQFELIQYSTPNASLCASIAGKKAGIRIRNYHLMGFRYLGSRGFIRKILKGLEKYTCYNSTNIECVSKSNLTLGIEEKMFSANKATIVWNGSSGGVDLKRFNPERREKWRQEVRRELKISEKEYVFGFVGRITRDKGIYELLEAFQRVDEESRLLIIGEEEDSKLLHSELYQIAQRNPRIIFHPFVSDIERYYAAIDVIILPSYREGFGMVIAEAAAMGTPAIVSDIPGPIDVIIQNKTAIAVPVKDATGLANAMNRFLTGDVDISANDCIEFIKGTFDQVKLCEKIYERKVSLIDLSNEQ